MKNLSAEVVDLGTLVVSKTGLPVWKLETEDLNINLIALQPDHGIAEHLNDEVDVLMLGIEGEGFVIVDGRPANLSEGQLIVVPKGTRREIRPSEKRFAYLSCHRRRRALSPITS